MMGTVLWLLLSLGITCVFAVKATGDFAAAPAVIWAFVTLTVVLDVALGKRP